jgi:hypothetical protein
MPAHFGAYREYWLYPLEYPIFNAMLSTIFVAGIIAIARRPLPQSTTKSAGLKT